MKKRMLVIGLVVLGGCATMDDMRARQPDAVFHSERSVQDVAECILYAWQGQKIGGQPWDVHVQPAPDGRTVYSSGGIEFVDVRGAGSGSDVAFYVQGGVMDWRIRMRQAAVQECAE